MIRRSIAFIREVKSEMEQVSWSPLPELWGSTKVVLVTVALLSLVIGIFDLICARLVDWILR